MNDDKTITQQDIDGVSVKLLPVLGIAPARYITALFALAILASAFVLLLLPGIKSPGVTYSFLVDPPGSAIFVDGVYAGHAPCETFIKAGSRLVRIERPGFTSLEMEIRTEGRIFGTLLVKPRDSISISLTTQDPNAVLKHGMARFSGWALAGSPSEAYQIPMDLSDSARAAMIGTGNLEVAGFAGAAVSYASHAQSLRDAVRASAMVYGGSSSASPATLGRLVSGLLGEIQGDPSILVAFAASAPLPIREQLKNTRYYESITDAKAKTISATYDSGPSRFVAGLEFVTLTETKGVSDTHGFMLAAAETTVGDFRKFVADNPKWGPDGKIPLIEDGLADDNYLKDFTDADDRDVLRYVSRPAAIAYCEWLSDKAPEGYVFSLPSESQWAYAAAISGKSAHPGAVLLAADISGPVQPRLLPRDSAGFKALLGNVWEWSSDSYAVHPDAGIEGRLKFPSSEAVVRGGSWANRADLVSLDSRGTMPESRCTAYLGFRIALIPDRD